MAKRIFKLTVYGGSTIAKIPLLTMVNVKEEGKALSRNWEKKK